MKITLIYDNTVHKKGLRADWGFACLIEIERCPKVLFDTGANRKILLSNMKGLDIDPSSIEEVMISHNHWDHTGGLSDILKANNNIKLYVPASFPDVSGAKEVVSVDNPLGIHDDVFSTGELSNIEQSLIVKTQKGLTVIAGCSHSGVTNILKVASQFGRPYALIGGLHGFREFDVLKGLTLVCACHCTQYQSEIQYLYPDKYIGGGAGKVITI